MGSSAIEVELEIMNILKLMYRARASEIVLEGSLRASLKTVVNKKSVNQGKISARRTSNRQCFKKVTCPFKFVAKYES